MKISFVMASIFAITMSHPVYTVTLSNALGFHREENGEVRKEINFDEMLQNLNLTSLRILLKTAKLFDTLNDPTKSHTVFAPTNKAIANAKLDPSNVTRITEIMKYHVHDGSFRTAMITRDMRLKTMLGGEQKIRFEFYAGVIYGSCQPLGKGEELDQTYNNGILDVLHGVMVPPEGDFLQYVSSQTTFSSFQSYVTKARLKELLSNPGLMTLLAPTDAAFKKLAPDVTDRLQNDMRFLTSVLEYHILTDIYCSVALEDGQEVETIEGSTVAVHVSGGKLVFNNSTVTLADTIAYNGVIDVIDTVLLPPQSF